MSNRTVLDYAISTKCLPNSKNWVLVFTRLGKYFFFNSKTGSRFWIPPESILSDLRLLFETKPQLKQNLFDPFYFEEEEEEIEEENDDDIGNENSNDSNDDDKINDKSEDDVIKEAVDNVKISKIDAEDEFKVYLMKNSIDPFAPWPTILSIHGSSPQFLAVPLDKRRQEIFSQICPLLIESKRAEKAQKIAEARDWWTEFIREPAADKMTWFFLLKRIKESQRHTKLFSLLNEKDCEKEYKSLLKK